MISAWWLALALVLAASAWAFALVRGPTTLVVPEEPRPPQAPPPRSPPPPLVARHVAITSEHLEAARAIAWALMDEGFRAGIMGIAIPHDSEMVEAAAREIALLVDTGWEQGVVDLREALAERSGLPRDLVEYAVMVALEGVVHRDIKPDNVVFVADA